MPTLKMARPYPQQVKFFEAVTPYVAYGGARGGGKSWAVRSTGMISRMRWIISWTAISCHFLTWHRLETMMRVLSFSLRRTVSREMWMMIADICNGGRLVRWKAAM